MEYTHSRGFTIIETLIAVAILMIAIAGPLVIASKSLTAAQYAKNQATASFLAQESMQAIKNVRDNNLSVSPARSFLNALDYCTGNTFCDASALDSPTPSAYNASIVTCQTPQGSSGGCPLYYGTDGYVHNAQGSNNKSIFSRYFQMDRKLNSSDDYTSTVVVNWNEGSVPQAVTLRSELTNAVR